jgi:hypothetical protein
MLPMRHCEFHCDPRSKKSYYGEYDRLKNYWDEQDRQKKWVTESVAQAKTFTTNPFSNTTDPFKLR